MKVIYLKEKKSGNLEFSDRENASHKFKRKKALKEFLFGVYVDSDVINEYTKKPLKQRKKRPEARGFLVKASYKYSQTYFRNWEQLKEFLKK